MVVPEVRHEFMAFSDKYDEIFGQALNNVYINDDTAINNTIQGLIAPLKNMTLLTEESWSNSTLGKELMNEFDRIFDPNVDGSLGSIVNGLSPTGDLTEEVISEL
ncbi:MAG: hypothetical protein LUC37_02985 [Prevotella sp.]|nr:hypothetical protein [Prevotella sp.]